MKIKKIKRYAEKLYLRLEKLFEITDISCEPKLIWLSDNKNRIISIAASLYLEIPQKTEFDPERVLALAFELVKQSGGVVNSDTVELTKDFSLSFAEFDFLKSAFTLALLENVSKILQDKEKYCLIATETVRSLIMLDGIDFSGLRKKCLKQEALLQQNDSISDECTLAQLRINVAGIAKKLNKSEEETVRLLQSFDEPISVVLGRRKKDLFIALGRSGGGENTGMRLGVYILFVVLLSGVSTLLLSAAISGTVFKTIYLIFFFLSISVCFVQLINRQILKRIKPQNVFALKPELADVKENKTAVTLTVMVNSAKAAKKALETTEEYFLGNRIDNGVYLILADLKESKNEHEDSDEPIISTLTEGIEELNRRFDNRFCLVVRKRKKNRDSLFCGRERKRGALEEIVEFIKTKEQDFLVIKNPEALENVKYIFTLDADSVLPPQSVIKLIAIIAHPANRAEVKNKNVVNGFGLVQPKIGNIAGKGTPFSQVFAPTGGIDTYNCINAELNNDFFFDGSFCGKGIFDVDAYFKCVSGKIKPNTVLSHDLLEGELLHTLSVNSVSILDEFPQTPASYYKRSERWIRGDWLLMPWLFMRIKAVSKWKMFLNMLQSLFAFNILIQMLIAPACGMFCYAAWLLALVQIFLPVVCAYADGIKNKHQRYAYADSRQTRHHVFLRAAFQFAMLPFEAWNGIKSAFKAVWRRFISKRKILEWSTFAQTKQNETLKDYYRFMSVSPIMGVIMYALCIYFGMGIVLGLVIGFVWAVSPYIAFKSSKMQKKIEQRLLPDEMHSLKILLLRTQRFFYESLEDNDFLMPDNLQLKPYKGYAMRTSPTNLGFALLSACTGFISGVYSPKAAIDSLYNQVERIKELEHYKGHLLNWYDIKTKKPLNGYISTVDSGNYIACLIAVRESINDILSADIRSFSKGFCDMLDSFLDESSNDFRLHLQRYSERFFNRDETAAQDFINDASLDNCSFSSFAKGVMQKYVENRELLFKAFENEPALNEYLANMPASVKGILECSDFEQRLEECLWEKSNRKELAKQVRQEYRRIYNHAFEINKKAQTVLKYIDDTLEEIDFSFLYDSEKELFSIGYDKNENMRSVHFYDMLCSEARLTSLVAIALGKVNAKHWFKLSRPFTRFCDKPLCLSWSGTMFEYLMPDIFIKPVENSMLYVSQYLSVEAQKQRRDKSGIWGISESAFCKLDHSKEYKYKAFGVQATAIAARENQRVYSPYSAILAIEYAPRECMDSIRACVQRGMAGIYGMYEAIDFEHPQRDSDAGIVYSFMAHHSGMSLCALTNYLYSRNIRRYFSSPSFISAVSVLLDEKMPMGVLPRKEKCKEQEYCRETDDLIKEISYPAKQSEQVDILENSSVCLRAGSKNLKTLEYEGILALKDIAVYVIGEKKSSISFMPAKDTSAEYKCMLYPSRAEYFFEDKFIKASQTAFVCSENCAIIRVNVLNKCEEAIEKTIVFSGTSVLNFSDAFESHPAFNGLFVSCNVENDILYVKNSKTNVFMAVSCSEECEFATDRLKVLNGLNSWDQSFTHAMKKYPVTPCVAIKTNVSLLPKEEKEIDFFIALDADRAQTDKILKNIKNKAAVNLRQQKAAVVAASVADSFRLSSLQWQKSLEISAMEWDRSANVFADKRILYKWGINDNLPLFTGILDKNYLHKNLVEFLKIEDYLFAKSVQHEILLIQDTVDDYFSGEFNEAEALISGFALKDRIHHIRACDVNKDELEQLKGLSFGFVLFSQDVFSQLKKKVEISSASAQMLPCDYPGSRNIMPQGEFDCGYGRFIQDGSEYYIYKRTPVPWINVICNKQFGFISCESGGGYTYAHNSSLNKLTPWTNDVAYNPPGEAVYLRDNKTGRFWSITRDPVDLGDEHDTVFGHGYTVYRYSGFGMHQTQTVFVHKELPIKITQIELDGDRDISAFYFCKPVMGRVEKESFRELCPMEKYGVLAMRNPKGYFFIAALDAKYNSDSGAFFGLGGLNSPQAVKTGEFSGFNGKLILSAKKNIQKSATFFSGYAETEEELRKYAEMLKHANVAQWLQDVKEHWQELIGKVQIKTPERKLDILFNNWLFYQTESARMLARCGFYQAGGAFGFRDQLQDCLMLMYFEPQKVREHILLCAQHQFIEGDVQHWWHPPFSGVRTKISDDLLFLPFVAARYYEVTHDDIFDIKVKYLQGHSLEDIDDLYENAWQSEYDGTLYEHCMKAIKLVISRSGEHLLPLMLGGDWNDGMSAIGKKGKGESVWLGWFLYSVISVFLPICQKHSQEDAQMLKEHAKKLAHSLNTVCWDGQWYRRAIDDSGRIIGSRESACCKIDAVSQAWAVLSGAGKADKCASALNWLDKLLVDRENGIVKLLTPPFSGDYGAGYICDYIPGVRENGGQYTHGALWAASAFAQGGMGEKCYELLDMINPITHTLNASGVNRYMLEPYSVPADVYSNEENMGRGGWSWYTASSSVYFNTVLCDLLGIKVSGENVQIDPHIPCSWQEYSVSLKVNGHFDIKVFNPSQKSSGISSSVENKKDGKTEMRSVM